MGWREWAIGITVNMGALIVGTYVAWPSPAYVRLTNKDGNELCHGALSDEQFAWAGAIFFLGAALGGPIGAIGADQLGRRVSILAAAAPVLIGWFLKATAGHLVHVFGARVLGGIATGVIFVVTPMYTAEMAAAKRRGALGSLLQLELCIGVCLVYAVGPLVSLSMLAWLCLAVAAVWALGVYFCPESPIYLAVTGHRDKALDTFKLLRGDDAMATEELSVIQPAENSWKTALKELCGCNQSAASRGLMIACCLVAAQQCSGINVVLMNAEVIFLSGGESLSSYLSTMLIGVMQIIASLFCPLLVDRAGRRPLLLLSLTGMALSLMALGGYMFALSSAETQEAKETVQKWGPICQTSLLIYVMLFCVGLGPIPWLMMAELFDNARRPTACAITVALAWFCSFVMAIGWHYVKTLIGFYAVFFIFAIGCIIGCIFVLLYTPETKGKTIEQIRNILDSPQKIFIRSTPTGN